MIVEENKINQKSTKMEKSKSRARLMLNIMYVLVWVAFLALMVESGAILFSYAITCVNPEASRNLYDGLNLYALYQISFFNYSVSALLMAAVPALKAYVCYLVIKIVSKVKLENPFQAGVAGMLERISMVLLWMLAAAVTYNIHTAWVYNELRPLQPDASASEYLFMAGLVYVISQVYKRGVEIQSENELTV